MHESGPVPVSRYAHSVVPIGKVLYMFGGYSEQFGWLSDVCALDTGMACLCLAAQFELFYNRQRSKLKGGYVRPEDAEVSPLASACSCACSHAPFLRATVIKQQIGALF